MTETKRDLQADLELCERATPGPWYAMSHPEYKNANWRVDTDPNAEWSSFGQLAYMDKENAIFVAEARAGWPHAIFRALEAEEQAKKLESLLSWLMSVCADAGPAARYWHEKDCRDVLRAIDEVWVSIQRMWREGG